MGRHAGLDQEKAARIRSAALDLFYEQGIEQTTMAQIAARAGIAKGTLYLYFPSRERLIEELFLYCRDRNVEACDKGLEEELTACAKLKRRIRNMLLWNERFPKEAWMQSVLNLPPSMKRENYETMSPHYLAEQRIIEEGLQKGEFRDCPAELLCEMFYSAVGGVIRYVRLFPDTLYQQDKLEEVLSVMLCGIVRPQMSQPDDDVDHSGKVPRG